MNLWLKLFCSAGVLLIPTSKGSIFFLGGNKGLTKKLEEKAVDSYFFVYFLVWFLYTDKCEFFTHHSNRSDIHSTM